MRLVLVLEFTIFGSVLYYCLSRIGDACTRPTD